ncbi:MAG: bifunctional diaminohydroxyphosphoribosylaminopyrimidine deaminase/5-amino-6-(5-phosphoribosylamino)uracil reductase RibD [Mediterranea sp.]|nr:bifunctional diaminohydroxyphosphoribosylaminopyrimidine deaminase/5-amino-6-(5-phosphoribosylamino)uracil reductase RibD [Mediterranea sp.]
MEDEMYMRRCLQLAKNGLGRVAPNPMVGAVVVCDHRIIGEGYHIYYGGAHAEVNAIRSVKDATLLKRSTIYVTLEPCAHYGKTPPCADLIIDRQIPRVVVGCRDPFDQVDGRGIEKLRAAGCEVTVGVLEAECRALNRSFITFHTRKRPYVTLKWAESADGFVDRLRRSADDGEPARLSTPLTTMLVHKRRAEHAAIMVGARTALLDRPQLTVRYWAGGSPVKVVADSSRPLSQWLHELYEQNIQSVLVEGGSRLLQAFIDGGVWDEAWVEESATMLGGGVKTPAIQGAYESEQHFGINFRHYRNEADFN